MDLRIRVKISNSLDINNNELVSWALKGEVTKGLGEEPQKMSEKTLPRSTENSNTCSPLAKGQRSLITLLVKQNWYKHHDESNERLKACSRLLLQPAPHRDGLKEIRVKSSSGNLQGRGDCFIPSSCAGDSFICYSLHLRSGKLPGRGKNSGLWSQRRVTSA